MTRLYKFVAVKSLYMKKKESATGGSEDFHFYKGRPRLIKKKS